MGRILVAGVGNPLMSDEGIGVRLVSDLAKLADRFPDVDFADLGTAGPSVVHALAGYHKVIFVDCAFMGEMPGTIRRFTPADVRSKADRRRSSLHQGDLLASIDLAHALGECPEEIVIFGIEPETVRPGEALSATLRKRLEGYVRTIAAELRPAGQPPCNP